MRYSKNKSGHNPANGGGGWIKPWLRRSIYDRDGWKCVYCGRDLSEDADPTFELRTLDHLIPASREPRPDNSAFNVVTCCRPCNHDKGDSTLYEWSGDIEEIFRIQRLAASPLTTFEFNREMFRCPLTGKLKKSIQIPF